MLLNVPFEVNVVPPPWWPTFSVTHSTFRRFRRSIGRSRPKLPRDSGPDVAAVIRIPFTIGRTRISLSPRSGPTLDRRLTPAPASGVAQIRSSLAELGPDSTNLGPTSADVAQHRPPSASLGPPNCPGSCRHELRRVWATRGGGKMFAPELSSSSVELVLSPRAAGQAALPSPRPASAEIARDARIGCLATRAAGDIARPSLIGLVRGSFLGSARGGSPGRFHRLRTTNIVLEGRFW